MVSREESGNWDHGVRWSRVTRIYLSQHSVELLLSRVHTEGTHDSTHFAAKIKQESTPLNIVFCGLRDGSKQ